MMKIALLCLAAAASLVSATPTRTSQRVYRRDDTPPEPEATTGVTSDMPPVYFQSIGYGGSGCPQGSASINFNNDWTAFTILFDEFIASAGPHIKLVEKRKNCQLNLKLFVPQGYQYSITTIDYRGYAELEETVKASLITTYYFQGDSNADTKVSVLEGPMEDDFFIRDDVYMEHIEWSPCGGEINLNLNTQIRVNNSANKRKQGFVTNDSIDSKVETIVHVQWQ
ncbi:hypothetical protein HK102_002108, partial [Quaeritorhiza haematococci]